MKVENCKAVTNCNLHFLRYIFRADELLEVLVPTPSAIPALWNEELEHRGGIQKEFKAITQAAPEHKGTTKSLWNDLLKGCLSVVNPPKRKR